MRLRQDDRAQSMTYVLAGGTIILFAGMYAVFQEPASKLLDTGADICVTEACQKGHENVSLMWEWLPLAAAMLIVLLVLASAIYASGRGI